MKGLILLLLMVVVVYTAWHTVPADSRKTFLRKTKPHAIRLGVLFAVVIALAYAAYLLPSLRFT